MSVGWKFLKKLTKTKLFFTPRRGDFPEKQLTIFDETTQRGEYNMTCCRSNINKKKLGFLFTQSKKFLSFSLPTPFPRLVVLPTKNLHRFLHFFNLFYQKGNILCYFLSGNRVSSSY